MILDVEITFKCDRCGRTTSVGFTESIPYEEDAEAAVVADGWSVESDDKTTQHICEECSLGVDDEDEEPAPNDTPGDRP